MIPEINKKKKKKNKFHDQYNYLPQGLFGTSHREVEPKHIPNCTYTGFNCNTWQEIPAWEVQSK